MSLLCFPKDLEFNPIRIFPICRTDPFTPLHSKNLHYEHLSFLFFPALLITSVRQISVLAEHNSRGPAKCHSPDCCQFNSKKKKNLKCAAGNHNTEANYQQSSATPSSEGIR